jgi:lipopolysaccharide export system protein LptC
MAVNGSDAHRTPGIAVGLSRAERERAFRAARRHSRVVKGLKLVLPLMAVGVLSFYFVPANLSFDFGEGEVSVADVVVESGNLRMVNPKLSGVDPSYGRYEFRAETAVQNVATPQTVVLDDISGALVSPEGDTTRLSAASGVFDTKQRELVFKQGVSIDGRAGLSVKLRTATVHFADQLIVSDRPVQMSFRGSRIMAQTFRLNTGEARAVFSGQVKVRLVPQKERRPTDEKT